MPAATPGDGARSLRLLPAAPGQPVPTEEGCCSACEQADDRSDQNWLAAARRARALSWLSLVWMTTEGAVGLAAGIGAASISLIGWALGSVIEGLASVIVIWRFTGARMESETAEARAHRGVAVSFFLLAPYLAVEAVRDLAGHHVSSPGWVGMVITAASVVLMPVLGVAKQHLGARLGSGATAGEGMQNLMCAAQAAAVLAGLGATAAFGWSWVDPAVALILAFWAVREGLRAWRGQDCC